MKIFSYERFTWLGVTVVVAGCASEVRVEGEGGNGADVATAATATTSTQAASSGSGDFDITATCLAICDHECIGGPMTCRDACARAWTEGARSWCNDEWAADYACRLHGCVPGNDCTDEQEALTACTSVYCEDFACVETAAGCSCSASRCEEGHTRRAECVADASGMQMECDCYENEALVYSCGDNVDSCNGPSSVNCCDEILRNGHY